MRISHHSESTKESTGLGYEEGLGCIQPRKKDSIKFVKSSNIDNSHSTETKKENQRPRRNERKSTKTEYVDQRNYQHGRN
jgi:hypothetical protein